MLIINFHNFIIITSSFKNINLFYILYIINTFNTNINTNINKRFITILI